MVEVPGDLVERVAPALVDGVEELILEVVVVRLREHGPEAVVHHIVYIQRRARHILPVEVGNIGCGGHPEVIRAGGVAVLQFKGAVTARGGAGKQLLRRGAVVGDHLVEQVGALVAVELLEVHALLQAVQPPVGAVEEHFDMNKARGGGAAAA